MSFLKTHILTALLSAFGGEMESSNLFNASRGVSDSRAGTPQTAPPAQKVLFVTGLWRSGTSLLYSMLNQHPQIALVFESELFALFPQRLHRRLAADWPTRLEFYNQAISRHRLDPAALPVNETGRECQMALFRAWAARGGEPAVIGGKAPFYHTCLPQIAAIFPEADFIVIWRDPLDCCRSAALAGRQNRFFRSHGIMARVLFGGQRLADGVLKLRAAGRRVHELTYNDLLSRPETEMRQICAFLGVDFDPRMLDLKSADYSMVPEGRHHAAIHSGQLRKDRLKDELLPPALIAKFGRYARLWRERYPDTMFARALADGSGASMPGRVTQIRDAAVYSWWRAWADVKRRMLCHLPLPVWKRVRQWRVGAGSQPQSPQWAQPLKFSIVTPSYRNSAWLKLCIASVADQEGVDHEHIIQDSCSDDGTQEWLPRDPRVRAFIEKDAGMYDAVNRGYRRATGDILAYLNCDEQYLPGGLKAVRDFFEAHPHIEVALAGSIITDGSGRYICHRHQMAPHPWQVWFRFPILTSGIFIRRKVIFERGIFFDTQWRDLGDFHWILELMKNKAPMAVCNTFTSVFADTGENMNLKPNAIREMGQKKEMTPAWLRPLKPVWIFQHRLRRLAAGHFFLKSTSYSIYTLESPASRVRFDVPRPSAVWWNRL
ncbi:MAG: sulfotransferase [Verrucomicrobia bacterium]|nr:sulfotransferase [Verrucomicrobiota bacterium]MDE3098086.1 sulfotransferase [Verrucomicrobiota bacterium]